MAHVQRGPTEKESKPDLALLEGPISLLWAYQLRREHAFLLTRIQNLADTVHTAAASAAIEELAVELQRNREKTEKNQFDMQTILGRIAEGDGTLAKLKAQLEESGEYWKQYADNLVNSQKQMYVKSESNQQNLEFALKVSQEEQRKQTKQLLERTEELEKRVSKISKRGLEALHDRCETPHQLSRIATEYAAPVTFNQNPRKQASGPVQPVSRAEDLLQDLDNEGERSILHRVDGEETSSTEIDLDENVVSLSYARHIHRARFSEDSIMKMLPELQLPEHRSPGGDQPTPAAFKQNPARTWEEYLIYGQNMAEKSPKRKQGAILDMFVEGIFDRGLRSSCEEWLDARVWTWETVKEFAVYLRQRRPAQEPSSTPSTLLTSAIPHKSPANQNETLSHRDPTAAASKELAKLLADQYRTSAERIVKQTTPQPNSSRRSQRILEKARQATKKYVSVHKNNMLTPAEPTKILPLDGQSNSQRPGIESSQTRTPCKRSRQAVTGEEKDEMDIQKPQTPDRPTRNANLERVRQKSPTFTARVPKTAFAQQEALACRKRKQQEKEQENKRVKVTKRRRGPPPQIPILPSTDSVTEL